MRPRDPRRRREGRAHPRRPRRRLEQGLPLPEGHDPRAPPRRPRPAAGADGARRRSLARGVLGRRVRRAARSCCAACVDRHGADAITAYIGNPTAHNFSLGRYVGRRHGPGGVPDDLLGRHGRPVAEERRRARSCTANMWSIPAPDVPRTDYFVVMGANPHASQGSLLVVSRPARARSIASASAAARRS